MRMQKRPVARHQRSESGATAVEFALVAPLFLLLVFGVVSFGTVFAQKLALGNAARQAARYGVVANRTCADITQQARDAAGSTIAMDPSAITVMIRRGATAAKATSICATPAAATKPCTGSAQDDSIFVTTTFHSQLVVPLVFGISDFPLHGEGVFRCEFS